MQDAFAEVNWHVLPKIAVFNLKGKFSPTAQLWALLRNQGVSIMP